MRDAYTPESYDRRVQAWMDTDEASARQFPHRTAEELAQRRVGGAELTAVMLLMRAQIAHPLLQLQVRRLTTKRAYAEFLPDSSAIAVAEWQELLEARQVEPDLLEPVTEEDAVKFWPSAQAAGYTVAKGILGGVELRWPTYPDHDDEDRREREFDQAAEALAVALVVHRLQGEDGQCSELDLGHGITLTTSLATAIVTYHERIANIWAYRLELKG